MKIEDLPEVNFIDTDTDTVRNNLVSVYEGATGVSLAPADPERIMLEAIAVVLGQLRVDFNTSAKQNLLAYAAGDFLDHLGAFVDSERDDASFAITTLKFTISSALSFVVPIDKGKRVSPDGQLYFSIDESVEIPAGATSVEVGATCTTSGETGNGYLVGQINKIVDTIQYVSAVTNLTESSGGAEVEDDESYQEKINDAPSTYSTAGPKESYKALAKAAHSDILDVSIYSPSDAVVGICVLMTGGKIPSQDILDLVFDSCDLKTKRPLTDKVEVSAPGQIEYTPNIEYYIYNSDLDNAETIKENINTAFIEYVEWQKSKLGRDIDPDAIVQKLKNAGAKRVVVSKPVFTVLSEIQIAKEDSQTADEIDAGESITALKYMGALDE